MDGSAPAAGAVLSALRLFRAVWNTCTTWRGSHVQANAKADWRQQSSNYDEETKRTDCPPPPPRHPLQRTSVSRLIPHTVTRPVKAGAKMLFIAEH